jgi:excisionase family DNA binding protein
MERSADIDDLIGTEEVARLLGVGTTAVKRWADQGLLACARTPGGHRRFSRAEVQRFLRADFRGGSAGWVDFLADTDDGHAVEARMLVERGRLGTWSRVATVLGEALVEMGRRWEAGALSIADEHLASERLSRALARLSGTLPMDPGAPRALLATAEGDDHTLGLALAELCLREAGWATLWAGRGTPSAEIAAMVPRRAVRLVALSASCTSTDALALRRQARAVAQACRAGGAQLALGGSGAWPEELEGALRFRSLEPFAAWARGLAARAGPGAA